MNFYQLLGIISTVQYISTQAYWSGYEDGKEGPNKIVEIIRKRSADTDHGFAFLIGRLGLKY